MNDLKTGSAWSLKAPDLEVEIGRINRINNYFNSSDIHLQVRVPKKSWTGLQSVLQVEIRQIYYRVPSETILIIQRHETRAEWDFITEYK